MQSLSNPIEYRPSFELWGSELTAFLAPERAQIMRQRAQRRAVRVSWIKLSWLAVVVAATSALVVHAAG